MLEASDRLHRGVPVTEFGIRDKLAPDRLSLVGDTRCCAGRSLVQSQRFFRTVSKLCALRCSV
jgi:hypothetical protein